MSGPLNQASGDTDDSGDNASPDQLELDITLDFKPPEGMLQGFWLSARTAFVKQELEKTDLATFAFGMIVGTLLGLVTLALGNVSIRLGTAGGLLIIWIIIGYLGSVMPTFSRVPTPARFVLMELGLMLFMAAVGLNAGGGVVEALTFVGAIMIAIGILFTLLSALVAYVVGRQVLGMNPALLLGFITGAMISTPALNVVTEAARSSVPALGYAGTYTFASVLLAFAGALMTVFRLTWTGDARRLDEGWTGSVRRRMSGVRLEAASPVSVPSEC